ncbi:MAG: hypothetical protein L6V93_13870 [Clostridiales bacterium]|nr:MAG: hypothetical protein L6V93_13870 [Clostridiales bacterium]
MTEIVRKKTFDLSTFALSHRSLSIFQILHRLSGFPFLETNTEPLFIPCDLTYDLSITHSFFGKNTCLILPLQFITASPFF